MPSNKEPKEMTSDDMPTRAELLAAINRPHPQLLELSSMQKLVMAVFTAGCLWIGGTVQQNSIKLASMEEKLETASENRYTSIDAGRDLNTIDQRFGAVESRVSAVENHIGQR